MVDHRIINGKCSHCTAENKKLLSHNKKKSEKSHILQHMEETHKDHIEDLTRVLWDEGDKKTQIMHVQADTQGHYYKTGRESCNKQQGRVYEVLHTNHGSPKECPQQTTTTTPNSGTHNPHIDTQQEKETQNQIRSQGDIPRNTGTQRTSATSRTWGSQQTPAPTRRAQPEGAKWAPPDPPSTLPSLGARITQRSWTVHRRTQRNPEPTEPAGARGTQQYQREH